MAKQGDDRQKQTDNVILRLDQAMNELTAALEIFSKELEDFREYEPDA